MNKNKLKICMIVPDPLVKGGIASVVNGYREYDWGEKCQISYIESYCNGSKWRKLGKALTAYRQYYRLLCREAPDIIHIHSSFGPSFYRKLPFIWWASHRRLPVINHIHGAEFADFYTKASQRKQKLIRKTYQRCARLVALSEEWKERLGQIVPEDKIAVIGNYTHIPADTGDRSERLLFMGEIGERKGCFDIPEILRKVCDECNDVKLVMAGDGKLDEMKEALREKDLEDMVSFPGWVRGAEKERLFRDSGIFLFPSYNEGMPVAVLEAMAYGLAIITTNVGGIPKLIRDGINGRLCAPGDVQGLADGLISVLHNPSRRNEYGEQARAAAISRYGIDKHAEKLLLLYQELSGRTEM